MKFILAGGSIFLIGSVILFVANYHKIDIERNGHIVKMKIEELPAVCLGTKSRYFVTFSWHGKQYKKSIKGSFCQRHHVGELIDMKMLEGSTTILFPYESARLNLISYVALGLAGIVMVLTQIRKMRTGSILFGLILLSGPAFSQYFEGKIVYENAFLSKSKSLTVGQLSALIGTKLEYFIRGGNYKTISNSQTVDVQLYDYKTNRIYNKKPSSDTLYWFNAKINTDTVVTYRFEKNADTVLGYNCDALILQTRTGNTTLYYSDSFKINNSIYKNHSYENWSFFTSKSGALPLKIVIENSVFRMESIAVEIERLKLQDDFFAIDIKTPIKKS